MPKTYEKPEDCAICFEKLGNEFPLSCGHWFHTECIDSTRKSECPMCRRTIVLWWKGGKDNPPINRRCRWIWVIFGTYLSIFILCAMFAGPYLMRRPDPYLPIRVQECEITRRYIQLFISVRNTHLSLATKDLYYYPRFQQESLRKKIVAMKITNLELEKLQLRGECNGLFSGLDFLIRKELKEIEEYDKVLLIPRVPPPSLIDEY